MFIKPIQVDFQNWLFKNFINHLIDLKRFSFVQSVKLGKNSYLKPKVNIAPWESDELCKGKGMYCLDKLRLNLKGKVLSKINLRIYFRSIILAADPSANYSAAKFHSARGVVASALDYRNIKINDILSHMNWKSASTFKILCKTKIIKQNFCSPCWNRYFHLVLCSG